VPPLETNQDKELDNIMRVAAKNLGEI